MHIAICDDEKIIQDSISQKIIRHYPHAMLCTYSSGEELTLSDSQIDILFLDIEMPGIGGMETARKLRKQNKKFILIFVTALPEYVFQAFDVGAFHYLVKPFSDEKFALVLDKAVKQFKENSSINSKRESESIIVKNKGIGSKIRLDDIIYAEVFNRKVVIHKSDSEVEYYGKISDLEKIAGDDFFRPHRSYLINFQYVEKYDATTIHLGKEKVSMSKQNYPEFVKRYLWYHQRCRK
jgi:DNA-binding LytR/AlgR family response regulator